MLWFLCVGGFQTEPISPRQSSHSALNEHSEYNKYARIVYCPLQARRREYEVMRSKLYGGLFAYAAEFQWSKYIKYQNKYEHRTPIVFIEIINDTYG